jgi:hypothetical protein
MDDEQAGRILERAAAALGKPSRRQVTMREHRRFDQRGWILVGTVIEQDSGKAFQAYWHPETERGWLWGLIMLPNGVVPRRFEPPDDPPGSAAAD